MKINFDSYYERFFVTQYIAVCFENQGESTKFIDLIIHHNEIFFLNNCISTANDLIKMI